MIPACAGMTGGGVGAIDFPDYALRASSGLQKAVFVARKERSGIRVTAVRPLLDVVVMPAQAGIQLRILPSEAGIRGNEMSSRKISTASTGVPPRLVRRAPACAALLFWTNGAVADVSVFARVGEEVRNASGTSVASVSATDSSSDSSFLGHGTVFHANGTVSASANASPSVASASASGNVSLTRTGHPDPESFDSFGAFAFANASSEFPVTVVGPWSVGTPVLVTVHGMISSFASGSLAPLVTSDGIYRYFAGSGSVSGTGDGGSQRVDLGGGNADFIVQSRIGDDIWLSLYASAYVDLPVEVTGSSSSKTANGSASSTVSYAIGAITRLIPSFAWRGPAEGVLYNGAWTVGDNWSDGVAPIDEPAAEVSFALDRPDVEYTVTLGRNVQVARMNLDDGHLTLDLGGTLQVIAHPEAPSALM